MFYREGHLYRGYGEKQNEEHDLSFLSVAYATICQEVVLEDARTQPNVEFA